MCVCVTVCEIEKEREREGEKACIEKYNFRLGSEFKTKLQFIKA